MKAIFISYNQAYGEEIAQCLHDLGQQGFTRWADIQGCGRDSSEPHLGNHAWPVMNDAILTIVEEDQLVPSIMSALKQKDTDSPDLGLRAFSFNIESSI